MPGFPAGVTGADILKRMRDQAGEYGEVVAPGRVQTLVHDGQPFVAEIDGRAILLATGVVDRHPDLPGVEEAVQKALVRICPICDGYEATDKAVAIIGHSGQGRAQGRLHARLFRPCDPDPYRPA